MDPTVKARWVEALRGGEYRQGQGALRSAVNEFCCLGVLCTLVDPSRWGDQPQAGRYGYHAADRPCRPSYGYPPEDVYVAIGLSSTVAGRLATKNDEGLSFSEIADLIEEVA
jgi:hypothetical protein